MPSTTCLHVHINSLHAFINKLNINERNIHLTYAYDRLQLPFLDLMIKLENGKISTCTDRKQTAANTLLQADSHHPLWSKNGIPTGQFIRIKRNCSNTIDYRKESKDLYLRFRERGYSHKQIRKAKRKAAIRTRESLLLIDQKSKTQKTKESEPIRLITTYGAQWDSVRKVLEKNWTILINNKSLANIVGDRPKMVARRSKNLGDLLIHSEYTRRQDSTWLSGYPRSVGMFPCTKCHICPFVERTNVFRDAMGTKEYQIRDLINCSTMKVVYMISCPCPKIYIGKTKRSLKIRIGEHLRDIKKEAEKLFEKKEKREERPVAKHFVQYHQGKTDGLNVKGIYTLKLPARRGDFDHILLQKEKWWIYTLGSLVPQGMNTELNMQPFLYQ